MFDYHGKVTDRLLLPEGAGFHPVSRAAPLPPPAAPPLWRIPLWRIPLWRTHAKRGVDVALALAGLTLLAAMLPLLALVVRLDSPGPLIFRQRRLGLDGQPFELLKFRTMRHAPEAAALRQATRHDPRVTRIGAWLRRTSIDEWPQLINVLRGDMSVVGPRPHAPGTRAGGRLFEDVTVHYPERHRVKPGLTGLAQVRGWRGETDTEQKLLHRIESDLEYIETWSLGLDLVIIWRTIFMVLRMRNAY